MDLVVILRIYVGAAAVLLATAGIIAWNNGESRNLVLTAAALGAAVVAFSLNLASDLRRKQEQDFISASITVDRAKPAIGPWEADADLPTRSRLEAEASEWLRSTSPDRFSEDRERLSGDLVVYSLLAFLRIEMRDWQLRRTTYRYRALATVTQGQRVSRPEECSLLDPHDFHGLLQAAGNTFAGAEGILLSSLGVHPTCFPPKTRLSVTNSEVVLENPFCHLVFRVEVGGSIIYAKPGTFDSELQIPQLPEGGAQFESMVVGVRVTATHYALRSQGREAHKYRQWTQRLLAEAHLWFEGPRQEAGS